MTLYSIQDFKLGRFQISCASNQEVIQCLAIMERAGLIWHTSRHPTNPRNSYILGSVREIISFEPPEYLTTYSPLEFIPGNNPIIPYSDLRLIDLDTTAILDLKCKHVT